MTAFEIIHLELAEFSNIFEPQSTHHFDRTFSSFEDILEEPYWNDLDEGEPCPSSEAVNCTPQNWYTEYWNFCAFAHQCADFDGYQLREICDYESPDDFSIWTGHWLDNY